MTPGLEHIKYFENLVPKQNQLWKDSADIGLWINSPVFKSTVRNHLQELRKIYKSKISRWGGHKLNGSTTTLNIPYELDGRKYIGTTLTVTYGKTINGKETLSISFSRFVGTDNPFCSVK